MVSDREMSRSPDCLIPSDVEQWTPNKYNDKAFACHEGKTKCAGANRAIQLSAAV